MRRAIVLFAFVAAVSGGVVTAPAIAGSGQITGPQVAAPVSVQVGKFFADCGPGGKSCGWPERLVTISFTSRVAIPNAGSWYEINMQFTSTGPCSHGYSPGRGGRTLGDLRAGQRVNKTMGISDCPGIVRGDVVYNGNAAPHARQNVPGVGYIDGLLVGTFSFRLS
jgi:hypothetical protein